LKGFDIAKHLDLLPLAREAGMRAIWFGIEDMTAELVKKGQDPEKTKRVFRALLDHGIAPMPMMMHHDGQPLWSRKGLYGLLNQVRFLKRAGAVSAMITFLTPSVGSRGYEQSFPDGLVLRRVGHLGARGNSRRRVGVSDSSKAGNRLGATSRIPSQACGTTVSLRGVPTVGAPIFKRNDSTTAALSGMGHPCLLARGQEMRIDRNTLAGGRNDMRHWRGGR
jgi:hypothetical protein